jgi:hypothetical protein
MEGAGDTSEENGYVLKSPEWVYSVGLLIAKREILA